MKLSFGKTALLLGAAAILAPVTAASQDYRDLTHESSDVLIFEGEVTSEPAVFRFRMEPDTSLLIDVVPTAASELDPIVTVTDVATGEVLAEDDDGGEGLAARARIFASEAREIEISVASFAFFSGEESSGRFELMLRPGVQTPQDMSEVTYGSQTSGELPLGGTQLFTISGQEGEMLQVALLAEDENLDPMLTLYLGAGTSGEELTSDDDGGSGLNSLLRFVLPQTGTYTIAAQAYGESHGNYTLRIAEQRSHTIQSPQQVLSLGERVSGYLGSGYENGGLDPSEITYQLTAETIADIRAGAGEVTIDMTTPLFEDENFPSSIDAFLELGFETPLGYASVLTDDDGGEGLNARITIDLSPIADEGDWLERLRIRAFSIGGAGAFEIEMVEGAR